MATLTVYDETGGEVGKYEIDTEQIADRVNKQLLHDVVVMYLGRVVEVASGQSLDRTTGFFERIEAAVMDEENVQKHIADKTVRKIIVVPGKLVNVVV